LKNKKVVLFIGIYLIFLAGVFYLFSGSPPDGEVEVYKGCVYGDPFDIFLGLKAREMKRFGVNIVRIQVPFYVDSSGNVYEFTPYYRQLLVATIQTAHRNGLKVYIEMNTAYSGEDTFLPGNIFTIPERVWPTFLPQWNKMVLEHANIAEKYGAELYAPLAEPDGRFGLEILLEHESIRGFEKASEWGQEILPKIRERYHGEIAWRGAITMCGPERPDSQTPRWETFRDKAYINFTGYDYIGFEIDPWFMPPVEKEYESEEELWSVKREAYREWVREVIDVTLMWAERDGCKGVYAAFGETIWSDNMVFNEGKGRLSGYFTGFATITSAARDWYTERLP